MDSYKKYRLNNDAELEKYQTDVSKYNRFVNKVYSMLNQLRVGERILVDEVCRPASLDIFIKIVCLYILYINPHNSAESYIEFDTDYKTIIRQPGLPKIKHFTNHFYDQK